MNKKFYFGLVATAALFAGCSSDDLTMSEARQDVLNGDDRAPIELLIGNPSSTTRGTGTVGGMAQNDPSNKWAGQEFRVYMLDKGALTVAKDADGNEIYKNAKFTAPNELAGVAAGTPAMEVTSTADGGLVVNSNVSYFPQEGNFDFWAYRTDGAEGSNVPAVSGTSMLLDFTIDGTQDIMVSKAVANVDSLSDGSYPNSLEPTKPVSKERVFSAYSVRRGVKPMLNFKHLLARIAFKVKGSKDLCDKNVDPTDNSTLIANDLAVKVTAIKLKSLATGKLHVAYTTAPTDTIEWTAGTEAVLPLKQRGGSWTHAELEWASAAVASGATVTFPSSVTTTATDDAVVYTSKDVDAKKGLPLDANKTTFAAAATAGILSTCYFCNEKSAPVQGAISVNADLVDLDPVAPIWNTSTDKAYATPVGEALLVAPQLNYELTVETSQKVPETTQTKYCTIGQQIYQKKSTLIAGSLPVIQVVAPATTAAGTYEAADADKKFAVSVIGDAQPILDTLTVEGTFYFKIGDNAYREAVVNSTNKAVKAAGTSYYYFASAADADAAVAAYIAWYADQTDETKTTAKDNAIAKGTTEKGKAVTVVTSYTTKTDSKTIILNGPSQTVGYDTTYKPYKANKSYTITLTLAGMEPITGETGNIGIGGYEVDDEGSDFDIDMDEQPSVSSNTTPSNP